MSFFRSKTIRNFIGLGASAGAFGGASAGLGAAYHYQLPFPKDVAVVAKGGLCGAGKAMQYMALPVTYPVTALLESKGETDTFLQTSLFELVDAAALGYRPHARRK